MTSFQYSMQAFSYLFKYYSSVGHLKHNNEQQHEQYISVYLYSWRHPMHQSNQYEVWNFNSVVYTSSKCVDRAATYIQSLLTVFVATLTKFLIAHQYVHFTNFVKHEVDVDLCHSLQIVFVQLSATVCHDNNCIAAVNTCK